MIIAISIILKNIPKKFCRKLAVHYILFANQNFSLKELLQIVCKITLGINIIMVKVQTVIVYLNSPNNGKKNRKYNYFKQALTHNTILTQSRNKSRTV